AAAKGLTKHGEILAWLKEDYGLGTGHARAVAHVIMHGPEFEVKQTSGTHRDESGTLRLDGKAERGKEPAVPPFPKAMAFGDIVLAPGFDVGNAARSAAGAAFLHGRQTLLLPLRNGGCAAEKGRGGPWRASSGSRPSPPRTSRWCACAPRMGSR